jgi:hypothetical protein
MTDIDKLTEFITDPPRAESVRLTTFAQSILEHADESHEAMGHDVTIELIEGMKPVDSVNILTGAVVLMQVNNTPPRHPLRPKPFMQGVLRAMEEKNAWRTRKGPQSLLA